MPGLPSENTLTYYQRIGILAEAALTELIYERTVLPATGNGAPKSAFSMLHGELRRHLPKRPPVVKLSELSSFSTTGVIEVGHWHRIASDCGFTDIHPWKKEKTAVELETFLDMALMAVDTTGLLLENGCKVDDLPYDELAEAKSFCRAVMREFWTI